jgi:hypothetical protein
VNGRVVLVPGVLALLPEYAGLVDPVPELRAACLAAVAWLAEGGPVTVVADPQGERVARALLEAAGVSTRSAPGGLAAQPAGAAGGGAAYLVVANGSARRAERAPGHLDERAATFDDALEKALRGPDPQALASIDAALGAELLAGNVAGLVALGELVTSGYDVTVDYADDPFGVQYWVMRWQCVS